MIKDIIQLLAMDEFIGVSKRVDVAKGIYGYPNTWKDMVKHIKRQIWQARK